VSETAPKHAGDGDQSRPADRDHPAGLTRGRGHRNGRPVREFRLTRVERLGNAIIGMLARAGIGPVHLLTTRGRKTGRPRTNPVTLVEQDRQRWLVAPYGAVSWASTPARGWTGPSPPRA